MKISYLRLAACLSITFYACKSFAQPFLKDKQEVTLSYGHYTYEQLFIDIEEPYSTQVIEYTERTVGNNLAMEMFGLPTNDQLYMNGRKRSGAMFLNYLFSPISTFSVGIGAGYEAETAKFTTPVSSTGTARKQIGTYTRKIYTIAPELRVAYNGSDMVMFYGALGLGKCFVIESVESEVTNTKNRWTDNHWMFQFTPIGVKVGKKISGFGELGYGYKGTFRLGASYKF